MTTKSRRLVVHIGPHKTASSYIQVNLLENRDTLAEQGWLYPIEGTEALAAHHHLAHNSADYLPEEAPHRGMLETLGEEARAKGQSLVLSAEGFCRWKPSKFDVLADLLGFDGYELVYVVRDPLDVFPSFWAEEVKQGRSMGFAERFAQEFAGPIQSRILNPMRDLNPLLALDRARVHVVPYDTLKSRSIDIFEHLVSSVLGVTGVTARNVKTVNAKHPIEVTEFLRLMTLIHGCGAPNIGSDLRLRFTASSTKRELKDLRYLVRDNARHARRVITVPENVGFRLRVEKLMTARLLENWSIDLEEDEQLFSSKERRFVYYDAYLLSTTDPVRQAADATLQWLADPSGAGQ